jgi:coenzyme F420-reducing hydrogenase gamma subunit
MKIRNYFTEHPASIGESYRQHLSVATRYSAQLFLAAGACAVHAVIPNLFTTTASAKIKDLYSQMGESGRTKLEI